MEEKEREGGKEIMRKVERKKESTVNWHKPNWTISKQDLLVSRGRWSCTTLIHKLPAKGCEAMQARVRPNTVESQTFISKCKK